MKKSLLMAPLFLAAISSFFACEANTSKVSESLAPGTMAGRQTIVPDQDNRLSSRAGGKFLCKQVTMETGARDMFLNVEIAARKTIMIENITPKGSLGNAGYSGPRFKAQSEYLLTDGGNSDILTFVTGVDSRPVQFILEQVGTSAGIWKAKLRGTAADILQGSAANDQELISIELNRETLPE
jgi:hypothetical protein